MSIYTHLTGGHGTYDVMMELRDGQEEAVWSWHWPAPIQIVDPLEPSRLTLYDAVLDFPHPGRYNLVLLANDEDLARHALQISLLTEQA